MGEWYFAHPADHNENNNAKKTTDHVMVRGSAFKSEYSEKECEWR